MAVQLYQHFLALVSAHGVPLQNFDLSHVHPSHTSMTREGWTEAQMYNPLTPPYSLQCFQVQHIQFLFFIMRQGRYGVQISLSIHSGGTLTGCQHHIVPFVVSCCHQVSDEGCVDLSVRHILRKWVPENAPPKPVNSDLMCL